MSQKTGPQNASQQHAQSQHAQSHGGWKLSASPESPVRVDDDVLTLRAPLVRVHRDDAGTWSFSGPGKASGRSQRTRLGAVVGAWPHVAALSDLDIGTSAVWSWQGHGWASEFVCRCGCCDPPKPADLDRTSWPADLAPDRVTSVEHAALSGEIGLSDIVSNRTGITLLGLGVHRRASDTMTSVAVANVIRRWPHTMQALRSISAGRGMRWNPARLNWHEYVLA